MKSWLLLAFCCLPSAAQIVVDSATAIVIDSREPGPLKKAAADLASDMRKVFGKEVRLAGTPAEAGKTAIIIALKYNVPAGVTRPSGREELHIRALKNAVLLTGSDIRGAIYAVYDFSQQFLGVDPLWWWTDHEPARKSSVSVPAALNK